MDYNWNWGILWEKAPAGGGGTYMDTLISGLEITLLSGTLAGLLALIIGTLVGSCATAPNKFIRNTALAYIEVFRNIPFLVQLFMWYFVVPEILPKFMGVWLKNLHYGSFYTAFIALGFYTASRVAVQVMAGLNVLSEGQKMASLAIGLNQIQSYRYILLPTVFRIILPPLTSEAMGVVKNSAVALTIGLMELTARTRSMQEYSYHTFEAFIVATVFYIIISLVIVKLMSLAEKKFAIPGLISMNKTETTGLE